MVSQVQVLSDREKELLSNYDSRLYGFLRLQDPVCDTSLPNLNHKSLLEKGVEYFEKEVQREGKQIHHSVFCKLGHFHLLLEAFPKALSAYQKFYNLKQVDYWKDGPFLYGLGVVYFNFSAYAWATKVFQQVLYLNPSFSCSNEIHLRLGIMFKAQNNYEASVKQFQMALMDSNPCSLSKVEIRFHLGHLFEMQNKCQLAQEMYDAIIETPGLPNAVKANAYKQMGWMYYNKDHLGDRTTRMEKAVQLLQKAIETDPNSGSAWYLIGRCYAMQGKVHDAFTSYRHAIDKSEANADTWCSIGVLYQQQNQPMDALQAYVCAIQLDPTHVAAWTDLGILYEACNQPGDAITCYNEARRYGATDSTIEARVEVLQNQLALRAQQKNGQDKNMPSVDEAWKLPIPAELTTRTLRNAQVKMLQTGSLSEMQQQQIHQMLLQQQQQQQQQQQPVNSQANSQLSTAPGPSQSQAVQQQQSWPGLLAPEQQRLVQNGNNTTGGQCSTTSEGSSVTYSPSNKLLTTESSVTVLNQGNSESVISLASQKSEFPGLFASHVNNGHQTQMDATTASTVTMLNEGTSLQASTHLPEGSTTVMSSMNTSVLGELNSTSLTDVTNSPLTGNRDPSLGDFTNSSAAEMQAGSVHAAGKPSVSPFPSPRYVMSPTNKLPFPSVALSPSISQPLSVNASCLSPSSGFSPSLISPGLLSPNKQIALASPNAAKSPFTVGGGANGLDIPKITLSFDPNEIPTLPSPPDPPLPTDKLSPPTPSIFVENKRDALSPVLQNLCMSSSQPITVVRGLAAALRLDLSLFSTKTLVETNSDHQVEIRTQRCQAPDENWDANGEKKVWLCDSSRSYSTIAKYAQYQASTFQESLKDEQERLIGTSRLSDSDSSSSSKSNKKGTKGQKFKWIKFGTNVDLSDERRWKPQLHELLKLPPFTRVTAPGNILSHVGHSILGMNSVQLYMKIPGCRTPGHQENNNFCAINVNIGPGDCEWFATPSEYWGVIHTLCEKNNVNYLTGSWWPVLEDLYEMRVPVFRFVQRPGDLVWINPAVVHWVQALGWCNNIAWNVGPMTGFMYNSAIERYEWNKLQGEKSIVAMIHLSWNLARNVKVTEKRLYEHIRAVLSRTLKYCHITMEKLAHAGVEVVWHGKRHNEASHYCVQCEVEVFNILFVTGNRKNLVYCQDCARKTSSSLEGFVVLFQQTVEELAEIYNNFKMHTISSTVPDPMVLQNQPVMVQNS